VTEEGKDVFAAITASAVITIGVVLILWRHLHWQELAGAGLILFVVLAAIMKGRDD
jgi:hypothetical protein